MMTCCDCGIQKMVSAKLTQKRCISCSGKHRAGKKNSNWKGGVTPNNHKIRNSPEYKLWRKAIFERDNYTCVWCGQYGGQLNADHIKPFAKFPELRFDLSNGKTLCVPCHKKTDSYLSKALIKTEVELGQKRNLRSLQQSLL